MSTTPSRTREPSPGFPPPSAGMLRRLFLSPFLAREGRTSAKGVSPFVGKYRVRLSKLIFYKGNSPGENQISLGLFSRARPSQKDPFSIARLIYYSFSGVSSGGKSGRAISYEISLAG